MNYADLNQLANVFYLTTVVAYMIVYLYMYHTGVLEVIIRDELTKLAEKKGDDLNAPRTIRRINRGIPISMMLSIGYGVIPVINLGIMCCNIILIRGVHKQ